MIKLNTDSLKLISHSLGINLIEKVISPYMKHKSLPNEFYRNYYNAPDGHYKMNIIKKLLKIGVMEKFEKDYYRITEKGLYSFREMFESIAIAKKPKDRDTEYLKHRINFYCPLLSSSYFIHHFISI